MLLRSLLFVPGNRPERIEKALKCGADGVIIDLEDAVPVLEKEHAREIAAQKLEHYGGEPLFVRINGLTSEFALPDIQAVVKKGLKGLMVPKIEVPSNLQDAHELLTAAERHAGLKPCSVLLMPLIESAAGVENLYDILQAPSASQRPVVVAFGAADYSLDLGIDLTIEGTELLYPRSRIAVACRAADLPAPVDAPFMIDIKDIEALKADASRARQLGFQGKLVIHPMQVEPCNRIFSPSRAEVEAAMNIVEAFENSHASGSGAIQINGKFIDEPIVKRARQVLAKAEEMKKRRQ